jgi:hypothetical protein
MNRVFRELQRLFAQDIGIAFPGFGERDDRPGDGVPDEIVGVFGPHRRLGSHVPYESLVELRAAYTPDAARAVSGHLPKLIPEEGSPPVLTSPNPLSTLLQRFARARLSRPCLPESCPGVSATLTTAAFDRSSLRWLEIGT